MTDYIRKAVELADGWGLSTDGYYYGPYIVGASIHLIKRSALDALAAQLVRQVDAVHHYTVVTYIEQTEIEDWAKPHTEVITVRKGHDRTMNTIKAIVDSGVLNV